MLKVSCKAVRFSPVTPRYLRRGRQIQIKSSAHGLFKDEYRVKKNFLQGHSFSVAPASLSVFYMYLCSHKFYVQCYRQTHPQKSKSAATWIVPHLYTVKNLNQAYSII